MPSLVRCLSALLLCAGTSARALSSGLSADRQVFPRRLDRALLGRRWQPSLMPLCLVDSCPLGPVPLGLLHHAQPCPLSLCPVIVRRHLCPRALIRPLC